MRYIPCGVLHRTVQRLALGSRCQHRRKHAALAAVDLCRMAAVRGLARGVERRFFSEKIRPSLRARTSIGRDCQQRLILKDRAIAQWSHFRLNADLCPRCVPFRESDYRFDERHAAHAVFDFRARIRFAKSS